MNVLIGTRTVCHEYENKEYLICIELNKMDSYVMNHMKSNIIYQNINVTTKTARGMIKKASSPCQSSSGYQVMKI